MSRSRRTPGLRKRGQYWHIEKRIRGYGALNESTGCTVLEDAELYLQKRLEEIRRVTLFGERPKFTFRQARDKFLKERPGLRSRQRYEQAFRSVDPYIGEMDLPLIHDGSLAPYKKDRLAAGIAAGTINTDLSHVRSVLSAAARVWRHENGMPYIDTVPLLRMVEGAARKPYPLTWDEQARLFAALPRHLADIALFAVNTGLRSAELVQLRWDWEVKVPELGEDERVFILPDWVNKNGRERVVLLNSVARRVIDEQRGKHAERVFTYRRKPVTRILNDGWKDARKRVGLEHVRVHDLRHTFAHRLRAEGVSLEDRKALMGHAIGDVTTHYSAADLAALRERVELIAQRGRGTVLRVVSAATGKSPALARGAA